MTSSDADIRVLCKLCGRETRHAIKHTESPDQFNDYQLIRCLGCDAVSMRHSMTTLDFDEVITLYPPRTSRKKPEWVVEIDEVDPSMRALLDEVYVAVDGKAPRLTAMGVRSVFDHVMRNKVGDHGTFDQTLDAFEDAKFISSTQKETLKIVIDVGSATIHRGFLPNDHNIDAILGVMESVVKSIYIDHPAMKRIQIPPRPTPVKKAKP